MIRKYFAGSSFARNVISLVTGTALAQVINFIFTVFLARAYSTAEFGTLSIFLSIVSLVLVFSTGKYDVAMVVARDERDAPRLLSLGMTICMVLAVITSAAAAVIMIFDLPFYEGQEVHGWLLYVPLSLVLLTGGQMFWMWYVREKNFKPLAGIRVAEAISYGAFALLFKSLDALGLLIATLISQLVAFTALGTGILKKGGLGRFIFPAGELKQTALRFKEFPIVNIPQGFIEMFQLNAVVLLLSSPAGVSALGNTASVIGLYSLCLRVLQVPMRLIVLPVSHVFLSEASERYRNGGDLFALVRKTVLRGAFIAIPIPVVLMIAGPDLFAFVFGEQWREAGQYARILAPWIFLDLVRAPVMQVASIVGKQKIVLYFSIGGSVLLLLSIYSGLMLFKDAHALFIIISATQSLITLILIFLALQVSKGKIPVSDHGKPSA